MTIIALDAGTTSVRAIAYADDGRRLTVAQHAVAQFYPQPGWVEHDAEEILAIAGRVLRDVIRDPATGTSVALGITNQRETVVVWERASGLPIHRALVWQDRRTADVCQGLREAGYEALIAQRTGLLLDPYFSATKIAWILDHVDGARARAERGELLAGTIDTWLVWHLTGGRVHATDATNASRTQLYDLHRAAWDDELCALFRVPRRLLAEVRPSLGDFGACDPHIFPLALPIRGVIGDQQAAAVGQVCLQPGTVKATFGTGAFVLAHTGLAPVVSQHRLLTTVALATPGTTTFALEGSVFNAGTVVQWLRDELGLIPDAAASAAVAASVADTGGVHLVPAFTGLGAPWWDPQARGVICGLTRATGRAHLVRAGLESVAYQSEDLLTAMVADGASIDVLRVDGGMAANDWFCQFLADQLGVIVDRPRDIETTVRGAAILAAVGASLLPGLEAASTWWQSDRRFTPAADALRLQRRAAWLAAVARARS